MVRCQHYQEAKKLATEQALQAILADEKEGPPAMKVLAKELDYTYGTLRRYFPELMADVLAKQQAFVKVRNLQRQQQLETEVRRLTKELYDQGIDPTLRQLGLRLPNHKMIIIPHLRQAWLETRQELDLRT